MLPTLSYSTKEFPMPTSPIQPTIGRVVLVRLFDDGGTLDAEAPAIINGTRGDINIDVCIMPQGCEPYPIIGLVYHQEDECNPETIDQDAPGVWRWMPYQLANDPQSKGANNTPG